MDSAGKHYKPGYYERKNTEKMESKLTNTGASVQYDEKALNSGFQQLKICILLKITKAKKLLFFQGGPIREMLSDKSSRFTFCRTRNESNKNLFVKKTLSDQNSPSSLQRLIQSQSEISNVRACSEFQTPPKVSETCTCSNLLGCQQVGDNVLLNKERCFIPVNDQLNSSRESKLLPQTILRRNARYRIPCYVRNQNHVLSLFPCRVLYIILFFLFSTTTANEVWWSPGVNSKLISSSQICQWARPVGGKQEKMCRNQMDLIGTVKQGIELGVDGCQREMQDYRWNCSQNSKNTFGHLMWQDVREAAFVQAITSAAITYEVTLACAKGDIGECGCTNTEALRSKLLQLEAKKHNVTVEKEKLKYMVDNFDWGGCGDNIEYGVAKSKEFLSFTKSNRVRSPNMFKEKMKEHNQEAGRLAIKNHMRPVCRCHGLTGSCTMQACWNNMERFTQITARLKTKYKSAIRVSSANGGNDLIPILRRSRKKRRGRSGWAVRSTRSLSRKIHSNRARERAGTRPRSKRGFARKYLNSESIVYAVRSPSFCSASQPHGSLGTRGRLCRASPRGLGSCKYLCCGRGYRSKTIVETRPCNCRLNFCCVLDCDECKENVTLHYCL